MSLLCALSDLLGITPDVERRKARGDVADLVRVLQFRGGDPGLRSGLRLAAVNALGVLSDPVAVPALTALLHETVNADDPEAGRLRLRVVDTLGCIGGKHRDILRDDVLAVLAPIIVAWRDELARATTVSVYAGREIELMAVLSRACATLPGLPRSPEAAARFDALGREAQAKKAAVAADLERVEQEYRSVSDRIHFGETKLSSADEKEEARLGKKLKHLQAASDRFRDVARSMAALARLNV